MEKHSEICIYRMPRVVGAVREKRNLLTDFESKSAAEAIKYIKDNRLSIIAKTDILQACLLYCIKKKIAWNLQSFQWRNIQ